ncbi:MAG TPA: hypothetical protein VE439_00040 [Anaerolineae bacterium]|jgi:glyceraldehyde-3-phosphate dehydrogenase (NAD(P))|nr:hypothetical protein [Anaerolineae bacterium]
MARNKVRIGINGYGVIDKRVADAVAKQDDMELAGVSGISHDYRIRVAAERGYPIYVSTPETRFLMEESNIPVVGTIDDLLKQVDVIRELSSSDIVQILWA